MPAFPVDPRRASWCSPDGRSKGSFRPNGVLQHYGPKMNPSLWDSDETWGARLFVGLSVGTNKTWTQDDVVRIVRGVREEQVGSPDSSFVMQRGLYSQTVGDQKIVVDEDSVQVIIVNLPQWEVTPEAFKAQMVALAEALAQDLRQQEVIVEIQRNGIYQQTIGVGP